VHEFEELPVFFRRERDFHHRPRLSDGRRPQDGISLKLPVSPSAQESRREC
jgi:hypothetical protein